MNDDDDGTLIETVCDHKEDEQLPTIVHFQNGSLGGTAEFCTLMSKTDRKKQVVVTAGEQVYTGDVQDNQEFETYICIRNKSTDTMKIVPVQQSLVSNYIYQRLDGQKRKIPMLSRELANKKLLKEFGGRKASRFVDNHEKMLVNVDVVRQDLDETVKSSVQQEDEDDDTLADVSTSNEAYLASIVPKCNKEATDLDQVYDVEDVIPSVLLERLDEEAKVVFATPASTLPIKSEYLKNCITRIQEKSLTSKQDMLHIKIIIYLDALQSLISLRSRQMQKVELSRITEKIENDIRHRFEDPNVAKRGTRTNFSTEKALTHFIVLALLISEKHEVDINVLSRLLATSKERIKQYAHLVNALPKSRSDTLSLRLPSKVPPLKAGRRFQRKK
ncbi:DNA-directed RNA polymerase I subunit RPA49 [Drosophila serrata]|uniref:DNA-directed RNA polymerase I subunit RPA49 n=1 Tax=Drosophila serrata TaxID=7274 RepID=UPI000A1CFCC5|nr:DNA-directed RNA polymerase I subunit RPA49 [Drosophila serrata]